MEILLWVAWYICCCCCWFCFILAGCNSWFENKVENFCSNM